ncbi:hypothetical protein A3C89_02960 [Candidatus Kaiserbacteria bacterium RIFCSPHIGHO2_02_FULL_50_50]|uniref:GIY-YIG domain-containing protein n=1 Tax=Candidatus Kaiserbacteria bacterium RIFCSPHIGHO2_02_FULL_50_50 TaxID=1798492 RepID=A0A1F6DCZ0_9BACT|nr:MAG: hypothetical protein A3C89_02960 [Candidatus Kaiserbacteria bacterium RIFCSPHIGHO2_02_FULL_50_50]OGG88646.1 MAG: hypothetical protein A3G62_00945 [Candidatus Kaiserbacteria bacterium RIFCSPLOWO2_12_FULL_50_10]
MAWKKYNFWVYMMASGRNGTIYVGVTNSLSRRVLEHKLKEKKGFTEKYDVANLVYSEHHTYIINAIDREKEIKDLSRAKKIALIEVENIFWKDQSIDEGL